PPLPWPGIPEFNTINMRGGGGGAGGGGGPLWSPRGGDGHAHHTTNSGETDSPYPCFFNNLRQNSDTGLDLLGPGTTISKAQVMFPIARIDKKPFTYRHQYTFLLCKTLYILSKDMLWQTEPDEKATFWACPLCIIW